MRSESDHFAAIRQHVPGYYRESPETAALLDALGEATGLCGDALEDLKLQFFPSTATWSLPLWERKLGILTDVGSSDDERRAEIRRKLVARGSVTAATVADLGRAYTGYDAEVVVHPDYSFELRFYGESVGLVSLDFQDLVATIEAIKPAHLRFVISSLTWEDLESVALTWQYFDDNPTTWGQFESKICVHEKTKGEMQ